MKSLPRISESVIRAAATAQSFERGHDYCQRGAISNAAVLDNLLMGDCEGTQAPYYRVQVELDGAGIRAHRCTCLYEYGGLCKHAVALLLARVRQPKQFAVRLEPTVLLAELDRDALIALLTGLMRERPELYETVEAAIAAPASPASKKSKKTRRKKVDAGVYRRQVIGILHSLNGMRASEAYWHVEGLTHQLSAVQETAIKFLDAADAETALAILMALVEEVGRGIEYIDDSDGYLGNFMSGLGQPLAETILSLELSAVERDALVQRLEKQSRYLADYGMEGGLDLAIQAAQSGWKENWTAAQASEQIPSRRASRRRVDVDDGDEEDEEDWDAAEPGAPDWSANSFGDLTEAKLNVLKRQGRTDEYLTLCLKTGRHLRYALMLCELKRAPEAITYAAKYLTSAPDAHGMAERLRELGHISEALAMGERGLKLAGTKERLGEWLGPIEEAQGRTKPALQAWQAAFAEHPTLTTYETLKRLAGTSWRKLQLQVIQTLRKSHDAMTLAQVLLVEEAWDEAIEVAERRDVWYTVIETVADAVISHRPEWVVRVCVKQAERQMAEAKSKHYPYAAAWLKKAKRAYAQLGQSHEWHAYLNTLKARYKRRPALQEPLRRI